MSCYHPITAYDLTPKYSTVDESMDISFCGFGRHFDSFMAAEKKMRQQGRLLQLPCRHCVGCRLDKSREWANRVLMEQQYHEESWFLTLTYDDDHLPPAYPVDPATGEILSVHATLVKKDLQDFMKRLRKNSKQDLRYYAAGEYGTQTYRPHYHLLIFGLHLDDVKLLKQNFNNDPYYTSDFIVKCWPKGFHILGKVTWQSSAYVARYTMKKATHGYTPEYYIKAGIQPEFQTMSLRPAIGRRFYDDHPEIFDYDYFYVSTPQGGRRMRAPEYFRKLWRESHPSESYMRSIDSRINSELKTHLKLMLTDKDYYDILKDEEESAIRRITSLTRDDI